MKRLALYVDPPYREDRVFDPESPLNRDNCLSAFRMLKEQLAALGWDCHTQDVYMAAGTVPEAVIFNEMPRAELERLLGPWAGKTAAYAVLLECGVIRPANWRPASHAGFKAVFTWDEKYVDGKRYFKVNFPNAFRKVAGKPPGERENFCVMIAAHKRLSHPLELYSERERAIRWFEANHPSEFGLYGVGWDRFCFKEDSRSRVFNRFSSLTRLLAENFPSYRGPLAEKRPVFENSRFAICYENVKSIPGYITEKIFDCLMAGCIPVYQGPPDITGLVPAECFIDRRDFRDYGELYSYMKRLTDEDVLRMQAAAAAYLCSPQAYPFSDRHFAGTIARVVAGA